MGDVVSYVSIMVDRTPGLNVSQQGGGSIVVVYSTKALVAVAESSVIDVLCR